MRPEFLRLRFPSYWHYDILIGLKVMAETGFISDPRCAEALHLLESKRLPQGGFAAEGKHYAVNKEPGLLKHNTSHADWGPVHRKQPNPFVTLDALYILKKAGRI